MSDETRDLACAEYWEESIARSRRRREAAERQLNFGPIDSKRIAVPAALLAGGLAVTEVVTSSGGQRRRRGRAAPGRDGGVGDRRRLDAGGRGARAESRSALRSEAIRSEAIRSEAEARAARRRPRPKPKKPVVIQTVAQAQASAASRRA